MGGFLGGLLSTAEGLSTPLNQVMGARATAQVQANKEKIASALQQAQLKRQVDDDAIKQQLMQAQTRNYLSEAEARDHPVQKPLPPVRQDHVIDPVTGEVTFFDPTKPPAGLKVHPAPKTTPTDNALVQVQLPDGTVVYKRRADAVDQPVPTKASAAAMSGQTMQTLGRLGMSFNDLKAAIDQMDAFENDPKNLSKLTPARRAEAATAETQPNPETHGLMGGINNAAGAFLGGIAQKKLATDDPAFNTYLNNKQRVATAFTELLPRPNQALLQLEKGLSGADVNWNPVLIKNIQNRRRNGLDVLRNLLSGQGMLDENGNVSGERPGATNRAVAPSGNIDLRAKEPKKAPKPTKKDYGIFGSGGGDDE